MFKEARHSLILETLFERNYLSLHDLMKLTNSSESTVRMDLRELAEQGKLIRYRGGAQAINNDVVTYELSVEDKYSIEIDAKRKIAEYAASLVKDNNIIYIDAGTTTIHMLDFITAQKVTIVTNSISVAKKAKIKGFKVYVTGGDIKLTTDAFVGSLAQDIILSFSFDIGFFGTNGVDVAQGLTTPEMEEALIKKIAMSRSKKIYVLCDHTKLGIKTAVVFHPFVGEEVITDKITNSQYKDKGIKEVSR